MKPRIIFGRQILSPRPMVCDGQYLGVVKYEPDSEVRIPLFQKNANPSSFSSASIALPDCKEP